jgi:hypothetical protein
VSVTQNSKGWSLLKARLDKTRPRVKVGIFGEAAAVKHGKTTVGQIGNAHEHGLGVPRRSFVADTVNANEVDIVAGLRKAAAMVLDPKAPAGLEVKLLAQTGQHIAGLMRQRISSGIAPALSARYLRRKLARYPGATTPLIASGQMWGAIGSAVEGSANVVAAQKRAARAAAKAALSRRRRARRIAQAKRRLARAGTQAQRALARGSKNVTRAGKRAARRGARLSARLERRVTRAGKRAGKSFKRSVKRAIKRTRKAFR